MASLERSYLAAELAAIRSESNSVAKGKRLEALIAFIFNAVPGLRLEAQDVMSSYETEEIDLYFWNYQERDGLHFLDCPLVVECKAWSRPVDGRELRYFADTLGDRGLRRGILIALEGITGEVQNLKAGFFHVATSMAAGQTVLIVTGSDLASISSGEDLVAILRRRLLEQVKTQVAAIGGQTSAGPAKAVGDG